MQVQPYLYFDGRCEEALEFYRTALGARIEELMRFKDAPAEAQQMEGCGGAAPEGNKVMHASFKIGDTTLLASDGLAQGKPEFKGISLTLQLPDEAEVKRLFDALQGNGGQVQMPLTKTFFSPSFGMVADRFGVSWMLLVA